LLTLRAGSRTNRVEQDVLDMAGDFAVDSQDFMRDWRPSSLEAFRRFDRLKSRLAHRAQQRL
jgi:hypothetical protein